MSTIATTAQRADSIDYWVRRHLFQYCYGAHPSQSGSQRKPPWDRSIILSAIGSQGSVRPRDPRPPAARYARQTTRSAEIGNAAVSYPICGLICAPDSSGAIVGVNSRGRSD